MPCTPAGRPKRNSSRMRLQSGAYDIVVENFLPGTLARWGVGYEHCKAVKADIEKLKLQAYQESVAAYVSTVQAKSVELNAYESAIKGESAKQALYDKLEARGMPLADAIRKVAGLSQGER